MTHKTKRACDQGSPNCSQVDKAKQDARNASSEAGDDAQKVLDFLASIYFGQSVLQTFKVDIDPKVQKLLAVLTGAILDVEANLRILQALFWSQTIQPDEYWMNPLNLDNFQGTDSFATVLTNLYAAAALAVGTYFTVEANPFVAAGFAAAGVVSIGMMVYMPYRLSQAVGNERKDLGY